MAITPAMMVTTDAQKVTFALMFFNIFVLRDLCFTCRLTRFLIRFFCEMAHLLSGGHTRTL